MERFDAWHDGSLKGGQRICLVTGANAGIGRAAAAQLAACGLRVVMACRDRGRGAAARELVRRSGGSDAVDLLELDLARRASIEAAADAFLAHHDRLDVLIHNAATFDPAQRAPILTEDGVERVWATNHLGPALLTERLLPALRASGGARVVYVTSRGLSVFPRLRVELDDPGFERRRFSITRAYYQSKLAQLCYWRGCAVELAERAVDVHGVRVTNVRIDTDRYPGMSALERAMYGVKSRFAVPPERMAETYTWLATVPALPTGGYWDGPERPAPVSAAARDPQHGAAVVALTRRQLGLEEGVPA